MAILSKLFEGFLDDGPQFVLRLVIVVLFGIGTKNEKGKFREKSLFVHLKSNLASNHMSATTLFLFFPQKVYIF